MSADETTLRARFNPLVKPYLVLNVGIVLAATLVAQTALDLLLDPTLVADAWREFNGEG